MLIWLQFVVTAAVIFYAGSHLSRYADAIAEKTGLGRTLIGLALLSWVTSLPELMTGMASVMIYDLPEIAVGNVLGSCMFNLLILVLLDLASDEPVLSTVRRSQKLGATFNVALIGLVTAEVATRGLLPSILWFGPSSVIVVPVWFIGLDLVRRSASSGHLEFAGGIPHEKYPEESLRRVIAMFSLNALITVGAASYLPRLGEQIAEVTGLGQTFVGSIFVGISTSLPEVVVAVAALRIGAADLAVANIVGSNLFNVVILALEDFAYTSGALLEAVSGNHLISSGAALLMTVLVLLGLTPLGRLRVLRFSYTSWGILGSYILAMVLLLAFR